MRLRVLGLINAPFCGGFWRKAPPSASKRRVIATVAPAVGGASAVQERGRWADRFVEEAEGATPIVFVAKSEWSAWRGALSTTELAWVDAMLPGGWKAGDRVLIPSTTGDVKLVACCVESPLSEAKVRDAVAPLATGLPARAYQLDAANASAAAFGWCLGSYSFDTYKSNKSDTEKPRLVWPVAGADRDAVARAAAATYLVRDVISTPAEDMGPADLEAATRKLADEHGATVTSIVGDDLLVQNYPQVHAVGRAAATGREPRVVELDWGAEGPLVVLVGKGVTFDTGGLDIKPAAAMLTMKKDMGGAAHVLGLADMVMSAKLPVRLKLLLGCAENSISGAAFRPGDVLTARNGATTEVANTDAEGRLVLADLLVLAVENDPDLVIDVATLTGAGRVALGTDVPAMFCNDDQVASRLQALSSDVADDVWRLPLWASYEKGIESKVADCKNVANGPYGGAIVAALYLQRYLKRATSSDHHRDDDSRNGDPPSWIHIDVMAYNTASTPGRPEGGEAMGMRALYALLAERYAPA